MKVEKKLWFVIQYLILKQTPRILKVMQQKRFACKQMNLFIEWMGKNSISMVNVEQYWLHSRWKRLTETCLQCLFFMYMSFDDKNTANAAIE